MPVDESPRPRCFKFPTTSPKIPRKIHHRTSNYLQTRFEPFLRTSQKAQNNAHICTWLANASKSTSLHKTHYLTENSYPRNKFPFPTQEIAKTSIFQFSSNISYSSTISAILLPFQKKKKFIKKEKKKTFQVDSKPWKILCLI